MTKIYIAGSTGMLGQAVGAKLQSLGKTFTGIGRSTCCDVVLDLKYVDAFDYVQIEAGSRLLFLSAISSPDVCEEEPDMAWLINVINTSRFIDRLLSKNITVMFASSDVVYGANHGMPHSEDAFLNPKGVYSKSKCQIERLFFGRFGFHSMRLSYVMGPEDKFIGYLQKCYDSKKPAEIFDPFSRSIVSIHDVVDFIIGFFEKRCSYPPVVNLCGDKLVSRLELAEKFSITNHIDIRVVNHDSKFFSTRERIIECKSNYLHEILGRSPIDVIQFF